MAIEGTSLGKTEVNSAGRASARQADRGKTIIFFPGAGPEKGEETCFMRPGEPLLPPDKIFVISLSIPSLFLKK